LSTTTRAQEEKVKAIEAGADDLLTKPVNQLELLARVKSLLHIKSYYDTIQTQAAQLASSACGMGLYPMHYPRNTDSGRASIFAARKWPITTSRPVWLTRPYLLLLVKLYKSFYFHLFVVQRHN